MDEEDDDFYDLDKDDIQSILNKQKDHLPMPIIANGFDFEDYNNEFKGMGRQRNNT